ncbi:MAG TPA: GatB/YqeY domain-containing protein [Clostridia bacterium]|nr:GatB/YqeY domain-containing protein [Clostridia bacterium]
MLKQQVEQDIKEALKAGEQLRLSALRLLLSAIKNEEIAKQRELTDEEVVAVVRRQIKQSREAAEAFHKGGREDLAQKEEAEVQILSKYLPQQLSENEIKKIVEEVRVQLPEVEKNNFGKVMGQTMARLKGKADGQTVSKVVKEILG